MIVLLVRPVKYLSSESQKLTAMISESWLAIRRLSLVLQIVSDSLRVIREAGLRPAAWKKAP